MRLGCFRHGCCLFPSNPRAAGDGEPGRCWISGWRLLGLRSVLLTPGTQLGDEGTLVGLRKEGVFRDASFDGVLRVVPELPVAAFAETDAQRHFERADGVAGDGFAAFPPADA